jgi:V-type H+-transporting ATPase subunit E
MKEKSINLHKDRIDTNYERQTANEETRLKQEQSAKGNKERIGKMEKINKLVDDLRLEYKVNMHDKFKHDQHAHKKLLSDLLLQGLIKLCEPKVRLVCRTEDIELL